MILPPQILNHETGTEAVTTVGFVALLAFLLAMSPASFASSNGFAVAEAVYTADLWTNPSGGIERDTAYLDNLDLTLSVDAESLWGLDGAELFLYGLYNNGTPFSETALGDAQVASNIETGVSAIRLYEAWARIGVGQRSELLFGLYDLNREFDALESSSLFIGSAHGIGMDISQSGTSGPSIFPSTSLSIRLATQWSDQVSTRIALLDGVPGNPDDPGATEIHLSKADGALIIGELNYSADHFRLLAGAWGYTADFSTDPLDVDEDSGRSYGNCGVYARGEFVLRQTAPSITMFARYGAAFGDFNVFSQFVSSGLRWKGIASRPSDELA